MSRNIYSKSVDYHKQKPYGKISIQPTKPMLDQQDLSLAYSPGVARPCELIKENPKEAAYLTARGNLIAVISNGTAVLGLGNIGALASKPVMEGKAVLFKKFAGIDAFDIEINEEDPDKLIEIIASLEPTFGGINLEDIKAPECFYIEEELRKRMNIPVVHDDQHGTAIVVAAGIINALMLVDKKLSNVKVVCNGAGAAAIACSKLLITMGLNPKNLLMCDRKGILTKTRAKEFDNIKRQFAVDVPYTTLKEAMNGADIFIGLSAAKMVDEEMVISMNDNPIIFALANPEPEIHPDIIHKVRSDAIVATGRSDYPNQVNNALCYPYLFRGALDVGARTINEEMKIACVYALAKLARSETTDIVANAYGGIHHSFGKDYVIPKPFDKRLHVELPQAVAKAAMDSGVAERPIECFKTYAKDLESFVYSSFQIMRHIIDKIDQKKEKLSRIVFAEGEEYRVLQAAQEVVDRGICHPILIGRPEVIQSRIKSLHLRLEKDKNYTLVDPAQDERFDRYWTEYHALMGRLGVSTSVAKHALCTNNTVIAALMVSLKDADGMVAGTVGQYYEHAAHVQNILGLKKGIHQCITLNVLVLDRQVLFVADPYVLTDPTVEHILEMTDLSMECIKQFNMEPKIAFVSRSNFGTQNHDSAIVMREAARIAKEKYPTLQIDGEMQVDAALFPHIRAQALKNSTLKDAANLLIMPSVDAAHIAYTMIKSINDAINIGPIILGLDGVAHIANHTVSVRGLVNLAVLASYEVVSS